MCILPSPDTDTLSQSCCHSLSLLYSWCFAVIHLPFFFTQASSPPRWTTPIPSSTASRWNACRTSSLLPMTTGKNCPRQNALITLWCNYRVVQKMWIGKRHHTQHFFACLSPHSPLLVCYWWFEDYFFSCQNLGHQNLCLISSGCHGCGKVSWFIHCYCGMKFRTGIQNQLQKVLISRPFLWGWFGLRFSSIAVLCFVQWQ